MALVAIYDACVLYPAPLQDLLIRVARMGVVRAHRSDAILDECFRNILKNRLDLTVELLQRTRELMNLAIRDVIVTGYESLIACSATPSNAGIVDASLLGRRIP